MLVRRKFQFRGSVRLVLGIAGLVITAICVNVVAQRGSNVAELLVALAEGICSALLLVSGLRAMNRPLVFLIDEHGFQSFREVDHPQLILWSNAQSIRQCDEHLTISSPNEQAYVFDCRMLNHSIAEITAECLNQIRRANGLAPIRETILAAPPELCCQKCGKRTSSLKDSLFLVVVFAYVYNIVFRRQSLTCPKCTRKSVYKSAVINLPLANVIWPIVILPLCLLQWLNSFRSGHRAT